MYSAERPWFNYPIQDYEVTDGDTIGVALDMGFHVYHRVALRIVGIDAPEVRLLKSREAGEHVQLAVEDWMKYFVPEFELIVQSSEIDAKYANRALGDVVAWRDDGCWLHLSEFLLQAGLVRKYDGGKRKAWSTAELRKVLAVDIDAALRDFARRELS
jgi:endonuclease YncB( thermonuclease family)